MDLELDVYEPIAKPSDFGSSLIREAGKANLAVTRVPLPAGDVQFLSVHLERVVIERKAPSDLLSSSSGRLQAQILKLLSADVPILLIDGPLYIGSNMIKTSRYRSGWHYSSIANQLLTYQMHGIKIVHIWNSTYAPKWVVSCYKYFQKPDHTSLNTSHQKPFPTKQQVTPRQRRLKVLLNVEGIGVEIGNKILDRFGTIHAIGQASDKELMQVDGVGAKIANNIKLTLGEEERDKESI